MRGRLRAFRLRLMALMHWRRQQREYAEELAFHQHMLRRRLEREGTPEQQLDAATQRAFGNPSRLRERLTELRQFTGLENILRDLSYAARILRKSPGFTLTAILTIALGIGASTAIFSLINSLLLKPVATPDAHQLVVFGFHQDDERGTSYSFSAPLFRHLEHDHPAFSDVFAVSETPLQIGATGGSDMVSALLVSGQYFSALQTAPLLGRCLTPADDSAGAPSGLPAVISERYWRNSLHKDARVIGRKLLVNRIPFTIVGVMPKHFTGTDPTWHPQIYLPLTTEPLIDTPYDMTAEGYHSWWLDVMGRRNPGISLEQAGASLASVTRSFLDGRDDVQGAADWIKAARNSHFRFFAESGSTGFAWVRNLFRKPLRAIFALCGGMLLLACLNLTSLLFARAATRGRELATRLAIGASRRRLMQQLLLESLLLASGGAAIGLAAAPLLAHSLAAMLLGHTMPGLYLNPSLDSRVLAAAAIFSVLAALVIGLAPAISVTGRSLGAQLKVASNSTARTRIGLLPRLLLSIQIALALMLVIGAGLITTSLVRTYRVGPGFDPNNIALVTPDMTKQALEGQSLTRLYHSLRDQIAALPGVRSASIVTAVPFSGSTMIRTFDMPGGKTTPRLYANIIAPRYYETMGIPLLAGRDFRWTDTLATGKKIILGRSAAEVLFPNKNALGQHVSSGKDAMEVIGIVADIKYSDIRKTAPFEAYVPITQDDNKKPYYTFVARSEGPAAPFAAAVRAILAREVPDIPAPTFSTLSSTLDQSLSAERMMAMLSVFFALCALLVTAIGLYGTLAYRTARRTSEIGIRMALGAQRGQVVSLVCRQNIAVTLIGASAGLVAALLAARALAGFLYGTSTHDPLVLAASTLILALVAGAASLAPAIRAARINPLTAIRTE